MILIQGHLCLFVLKTNICFLIRLGVAQSLNISNDQLDTNNV